MEKLPLEMKQRICSFLHASPKLLKPIRLVSKDFASAAAPYLIPRIFLFNHPDSCDEVQEILKHPVFSKYVNTLAVDDSKLKYFTDFQDWAENIKGLTDDLPEWSDFMPDDVGRDEYGDPVFITSASRSEWMKANDEYYEALDDAVQSLIDLYHENWLTQKYLAAPIQLDSKFKARFWKIVVEAFETCPSLANLIVAPPSIHSQVMVKRNRVFHSCLATEESFVSPANHIPPDLGLGKILQATQNSRVGLKSLTIVDMPINFADFSMIKDLRSVESLTHIRIGYNRLHCNPKTGFGFNLEKVLQVARQLQTFWVEMPPRFDDEYNADDLLHAINSKHLRDILLSNCDVSEDSMVDFLLRHTDSLQQMDLGITINPGTWVSTFQRVSKQMSVLKKIQLIGICEIQASEKVILSPQWCLEATKFLTNGGELSEPKGYDLSTDFEERVETPFRNEDLPEDGLWSDYDGEVNFYF